MVEEQPEALEAQASVSLPLEEPVAPRAPWLDRQIDRAIAQVEVARTWLPLAVAIGASPGLFLYPLIRGDLSWLLNNQLAGADRLVALAAVLGSLLLTLCGYLVVAARSGRQWAPVFAACNRRLLPVLVLPLITLLQAPKIEVERPWVVMAAAAAVALILGLSVVRSQARLPPLPSWLPGALAIAATLGWALQIGVLAVVQHHGLATKLFDLAIYDSIFWHSAHGEPLATDLIRGGSHVSAHVDPLLVLLSPLYLIYPQAETILVLQTVWLAAGVVPVWLLASRRLGRWYGLGFVCLYLLGPWLHGPALYDFHSLTLAAPLILWCLACIELGWLRSYWVAFALLLLTREDMSLVACFLGAFAILSHRYRRLGLATIGIALVYLAFLKLFVMPQPGLLMTNTSESYGYAYYYKDLIPHGGEGVAGLLLSLVINPLFALQHALSPPKLLFLAQIFLPLLLLPFVAPRGRLLMVYGFVFLLFASRDAVYSIHFQYVVVLAPFALGLAVIALAELHRLPLLGRLEPGRLRPALLVAMIGAMAVVSWKFGALLPNDSFRGGFSRLVRTLTPEHRETLAWVREMVARIGPDAAVSTAGNVAPHVSNRSTAYAFPRVDDAAYIFVQQRGVQQRHRGELRRLESEGVFRQVDKRGDFVLLERVPEEERQRRKRPRASSLAPVAPDAKDLRSLRIKPDLEAGAILDAPGREAPAP